jgi:hypothetical protein
MEAAMRLDYARSLQIAALLLLTISPAEAQQIAGTFDQLRVLVRPGDTLTVTDSTGQRVRGRLTELSASSLRLDVSGGLRQFQDSDVDTIEKRGADSLKNGALTGMAISGGFAVLGMAMTGVASEEPGVVVAATLLYCGIGAGIGAGIDALIEGRHVIYASSNSASTRLAIAPILSRSRKGVLLSLRLGP